MATRTTNFELYKPDATDNFSDFREEFNDNMDIIDENLGGGGGSGGHTIYDKDGTALAQENGLQFTGAVNVSDDPVNRRTVVDVEGGGNYYLNTIFSTEEKKVGYWTDGKPLYQKTINCGTLPNSSNISISTPNNLENLIDAFGFAYSLSDATNQRLVPFSAGGTNDIRVDLRNSIITITTFSNWSGYSAYLTIQYTKTTDTADPNPQFGNVIYLPTIYSEEERQVGVWKDGKPLYKKTWDLGSDITVNANSWTNTAISVSDFNIEKVVSVGCINSGGMFFGFVAANCDQAYVQLLQTRNTIIGVRYVTLLYTKTTDTTGSGDWTPSGAKAVHYSTNEQVIGTWIDGKPLYQRVWDFGSDLVISNSAFYITNIDASNIETIVEGFGIYSTGATRYNLMANTNGTNIRLQADRTNGSANVRYLVLQYTKTTD